LGAGAPALPGGRIELVRGHLRGNPALGIKRSRYAVVPPLTTDDEIAVRRRSPWPLG
jgi:hypothetical protein